jgi:hypothetical protein
VQHFFEDLCRGGKVKALPGSVVIGADQRVEALVGEGCEIGFARNKASHSPDGILDTSLLPRRIGIAEEGLEIELVEQTMACELGAIVEGDGQAQPRWQRVEQLEKMTRNAIRSLTGRPGCEEQPRMAFVDSEHGLTVSGEQHEIGFPMAGRGATGCFQRPFRYGNTAINEGCGAATLSTAEPALALAARQVAAPAVVFGARDLGVDEAVDALVADRRGATLTGQPAGDLFRRPACSEALENGAAQAGLPFQARARPAPRLRSLVSITWFVTNVATTVAPYLTRDRRWRAIQSCRDLPDRSPVGLKTGNLASVVQ